MGHPLIIKIFLRWVNFSSIPADCPTWFWQHLFSPNNKGILLGKAFGYQHWVLFSGTGVDFRFCHRPYLYFDNGKGYHRPLKWPFYPAVSYDWPEMVGSRWEKQTTVCLLYPAFQFHFGYSEFWKDWPKRVKAFGVLLVWYFYDLSRSLFALGSSNLLSYCSKVLIQDLFF